jgi:hypothetical protein
MHKASLAKLNFYLLLHCEILYTQNTYCTLRNIRTVNECKAILRKPITWFLLLKNLNILNNIVLFYIVTLVTLLYTPERKVKMIMKGCITIFEKLSKS